MRKKIIKIFLIILLSIFLFQLWGCNKNTSPIDNIKEKYGNKKFNITFDSTDTNIKTLTYSAYYIPELKNPKKVGYIFKGWFFDKDFNEPYSKDALYLKMKDITLYPKWEVESITQPGIYFINYEASIINDSVILGKDSNKVDPYKNICDLFIKNDIILEKTTDDKLLLKLSYDQNMIMPFPDDSDIFLITPNIKMGSKIKYHSDITSLSRTTRSIYFDITKFDLENDMIFNVRFYNYYHKNITKELLYTSQVNYQIRFNISNIIGIGKPFVKTNKELSDGIYKVKCYLYKGEKVDELSMLNLWNDIYMDLIVKDSKYYLYHTFKTYEGIVPNYLNNKYLDNVKHRLMTFFYAPTYYTYNTKYDDVLDINMFLPSIKNGSYFRGTEITFNAQRKEITHKYYLGETINNNIMIQAVLTGFMEKVSALGVTNVSIRLDRNSITKVGVLDKNDISGKKIYTFKDEISFYPASYVDLREGNILNNFINDRQKVNNKIANFFLKSNSSGEELLSHTLKVIPKQNLEVKDSKYKIFDLDFIYEIYDLNEDDSIIIDYNLFHIPEGFLRRDRREFLSGKSCNLNEKINLKELFLNNIRSDVNKDNLSYEVYGGDNSLIEINEEFNFKNNLKIIYKYKKNNINYFTIYHLEKYEEPDITITNIDGSDYEDNKEYLLGEKVFIPLISYNWMGINNVYYGLNKYNNDGENHFQIDYMNLLFFYENKNKKSNYYVPIFSNFIFSEEKIHIYFAVTNKFFQSKVYHLSFSAKKPIKYEIFDTSNNLIDFNTIRYHKNKRVNVNNNITYLYPDKNLDNINNKFILFEDENTYNIYLSKVIIYFKNKDNIMINFNSTDDFYLLINDLKSYYNDNSVVYIKFIYTYNNYNISKCLLFKYRLNNIENEKIYRYKNFYTDTLYKKHIPYLTLDGITVSGSGSSYLYNSDSKKAGHVEEINDNGDIYYKFITPGKYKFIYNVSMKLDYNGDFVTKEQINHSFTFVLYVNVLNYLTETVDITFISTKHPFIDNTHTKTKTFFIKDLINTYSYTDFIVSNRDHLAGFTLNPKYSTKESNLIIKGGNVLQDFAHNYASSSLTLYAVWDSPILVKFKIPTYIASDKIDDLYLYAPTGYYYLNLKNFKIDNYDKTKYKFLGWRGVITNNQVIFDNLTFDISSNYDLEAVFEVI